MRSSHGGQSTGGILVVECLSTVCSSWGLDSRRNGNGIGSTDVLYSRRAAE